jgi:hypothetical protein
VHASLLLARRHKLLVLAAEDEHEKTTSTSGIRHQVESLTLAAVHEDIYSFEAF